MSDTGVRRLTLTTITLVTAYCLTVLVVTVGAGSGTGGGITGSTDSGSKFTGSNSASSSSESSGTSSSGTKYQAQGKLSGRQSGVAFESVDNISFCYHLDQTNKGSDPKIYNLIYTFPVGPFTNPNTITALLEIDLFDEDTSGTVVLGPLSGAIQTSSLGFTTHGANLASTTINTAGKHMFEVGPFAGPTSIITDNFVQVNVAFSLSGGDRVKMQGMLVQDNGVNTRACLIPLTSQGFGLTRDMQKCANDTGKALNKSMSARNKELCSCIKALVKNPGTAPSIADCLSADAKGKLAKADAALQKTFDKKCVGQDKAGTDRLPPFGANDPNDPGVLDALDTTAFKLAMYAFGNPPTPPILSFAGDKNATKCQQALIKELKKCFETRLKEYLGCKKKALKAEASTGQEVAICINADPKGKIAKACDQLDKPDKLRKVLEKKCLAKGVALDAVFPEAGVAGDVEATHAGIHGDIPCLTCMVIEHLDDFGPGSIDCDLFDDGVTNGSCTVW